MQFVPVHSCTEEETGDSFLWAPRAKLTPDYHRVEGKSFKLVCRAHQDYLQCLNGACVKIVGVQSRSHSHTPQNSPGLCCSVLFWPHLGPRRHAESQNEGQDFPQPRGWLCHHFSTHEFSSCSATGLAEEWNEKQKVSKVWGLHCWHFQRFEECAFDWRKTSSDKHCGAVSWSTSSSSVAHLRLSHLQGCQTENYRVTINSLHP